MKFGGGVGIYKDTWEEIDKKYNELVQLRKELLELIMNSSTSDMFEKDYIRNHIFNTDDITIDIEEEKQNMRVRVCGLNKRQHKLLTTFNSEKFYDMEWINFYIQQNKEQGE